MNQNKEIAADAGADLPDLRLADDVEVHLLRLAGGGLALELPDLLHPLVEELLRRSGGAHLDLEKAHDILDEQKRKREDKFADSFFQETHKEDILAKKFEEAMKKAKDAPAGKPVRDFDLD